MFALVQRLMLFLPMPPMPIPATFSLSLGAGVPWKAPRTWRGTIVKPAAAREALPRNLRRGSAAAVLAAGGLRWLISLLGGANAAKRLYASGRGADEHGSAMALCL